MSDCLQTGRSGLDPRASCHGPRAKRPDRPVDHWATRRGRTARQMHGAGPRCSISAGAAMRNQYILVSRKAARFGLIRAASRIVKTMTRRPSRDVPRHAGMLAPSPHPAAFKIAPTAGSESAMMPRQPRSVRRWNSTPDPIRYLAPLPWCQPGLTPVIPIVNEAPAHGRGSVTPGSGAHSRGGPATPGIDPVTGRAGAQSPNDPPTEGPHQTAAWSTTAECTAETPSRLSGRAASAGYVSSCSPLEPSRPRHVPHRGPVPSNSNLMRPTRQVDATRG